MTSTSSIPQTYTTMEAAMTLAAGTEDEFWRAQEKMGPVVAGQPGFSAVIGGPIANSRWMYFCGKFETPDHMNQWYESHEHKPVMNKARQTWFDAFYIRKWRMPAEGEALEGPLFSEVAIVPPAALDYATMGKVLGTLTDSLPRYGASPFETLAGEFEPQPFQFVGPLEEFPQAAPVRYLLLTHWESAEQLDAWRTSPEMDLVRELGDVTETTMVLIRHEAGERLGLKPDGSQRGWARATA